MENQWKYIMVPIWFSIFLEKKVKVKEIVIRIWVTVISTFSCFVAIKIAVSVEISCSCKGEF